MATPADMNVYTRYYELRLYQEGTFRSRPNDMASLVSCHSVLQQAGISKVNGFTLRSPQVVN